jgi:hypothetical protein
MGIPRVPLALWKLKAENRTLKTIWVGEYEISQEMLRGTLEMLRVTLVLIDGWHCLA